MTSWADFLALKNYSKRTIAQYLYFKKMFSDNPTQSEVDAFILSHPYKTARGAIRNYVEQYLCNKAIVFQRLRGEQGRPLNDKYLTQEEYKLLLSHLPMREELISRIMFECGIRINEVLDDSKNHRGLTTSCVNFNTRMIKGRGKGAGKGKPFEGLISTETANKLIEWIHQNKLGSDDLLFDIGSVRYNQIVIKYAEEHLHKHVTAHWMKRSIGYYLETLDCSLEERAYALHHTREETTARHYSFMHGKKVMDKLKIILK